MTLFYNKKKKYIHIILSVIFIIGTATLISYFFEGPRLFTSFSHYLSTASFGYMLGFSFWLGHWYIGSFISKNLDWTKNLRKANVISLLLYIIYGIAVSISIPYIVSRFMWGMTGRDLFVDVAVKALMLIAIDMIVIAIFYTNYLTRYWKESIEANEDLKRENLLAKYEALKKQVNPHFLFNSLNTLSGVVEQKPELATDFIKKLSDIYRYVLEQSDKELVSLQDEMKFVTDYVYLSKMRFGEALIFESALPVKSSVQVVPLGLQMLVENAIKHNIIADEQPLKIEIGIEEDFIVLKNNIQTKTVIASDKKPQGLENLKKRFEYLSDKSIQVVRSDNDFIVKLPVIAN